MIENDLKEPFNEWVPASANFINYKEGIFYPYNDKIIEMFREIEDVYNFIIVDKISKRKI